VIRDVDELEDGAIMEGEVAVVGAGFAGLELASFLGRRGVSVVLLESGRLEFDPRTQELARVDSVGKPIWEPGPESEMTPYLEPELRGESRIRQFGGSSNTWTGKWRIFDPLDFAERSWVPHSGWPITFDEVWPFYEAVIRDYGLDQFAAFRQSEGVRSLRAAARSGGLEVACHAWQKSPLRLARRFGAELRAAESVNAVLGANATDIVLSNDLERVRSLVVRSLEGRELEVHAERFVLATGGLEVPRLLLSSNGQLPAGIGNRHGFVGRFNANHPKHKQGALWPAGELRDPARAGTDILPRPRFHVNFQLSDETQRDLGLLNHTLRLTPVYRYEIDYPQERVQALRESLAARDLRGVARSSLALARSPRALAKVLRRTYHRGYGGPLDHYALTMYLEQAPNPESRVYLGDETDALGLPKLVVDWRLTELDRESFDATLEELKRAFARAGLGRLEFGELTIDDTFDAAHHIGTTRMASSAEEGVVDSDCRVFGTENLYVASSSVFPTGHSMGPTLTIVALARRLGAHLVAQVAPSSASASTGLRPDPRADVVPPGLSRRLDAHGSARGRQ